jgi:hypothetical protein
VFVVLLVAAWLVTSQEGAGPEYRLAVGKITDGAAPAKPNETGAPAEGKAEVIPEEGQKTADRIEVQGPKGTLAFQKSPEGLWKLVAPREAGVQAQRVAGIFRLFEEGLESSMGYKVTEAQLGDYGLEPQGRIRLCLKQGSETILDLLVGGTEPGAEEGALDSFVMLSGEEVVYRVVGKDLRSALDLDAEAVVDRKLFEFKVDEVQRVLIRDPRDPKNPELSFSRDPSVDNDGNWKLDQPAGQRIEGLASFLSTISTLNALKIVDKLPGADQQALDKTYSITMSLSGQGDPRELKLEIGAGRADGVWVRLGDGRIAKIAVVSANQLMKGLGDFRDKRVFSFDPKSVQRVEYTRGGNPTLGLSRESGQWAFLQPAGEVLYPKSAERLASILANLRAQTWLPREAVPQGWDRDATEVKVSLGADAGNAVHTLRLGQKAKGSDEQEYWTAQVLPSGEFLQLADWTVTNLQPPVEQLKDKRALRVAASDLVGLELKYPDQTLVFAQKEGRWDLTAPKQIEGVELGGVVQSLTELPVKETLADRKQEEAGLAIELVARFKDGSSKRLLLSEEVVNDGNLAMSPDEPWIAGTVFTVSRYLAENLLKKLPDFEKPAPAAPAPQ